ncbi:MAG: dicarboxylate/amino acid:cation symporter, partial [Alphaproteobacteria bacterium]|nr:dicarboxylate/amino acid:cation symporter [Alphaproteobacteria bacterium]
MNRSRVAAFFTSLSFFVIAALAAGVVVGALAQEADAQWLTGTLGVVESLGQVWLNALRMTVIPLVFSLLVTGIVSIADAAATGRIAVRSLTVFGLLLVGATVYAILAGLGLLALWPIDPEAGRALLAGVPADSLATVGEAARTDGLRAFLASLAPANLIKAAADDGVLAVVV